MRVRTALERIAEADDSASKIDDPSQQYEMYAKTLRALEDIDADDENEGVVVVTEWIVDRMATGKRPSSKAVRQRAAEFCRKNGYEIPNDSWLGR